MREDPGLFDAPFFSMTATEAAGTDPQQRWLLEVSYEAFENGTFCITFCSTTSAYSSAIAGISIKSLVGSETSWSAEIGETNV